jgi:hypothetical protein
MLEDAHLHLPHFYVPGLQVNIPPWFASGIDIHCGRWFTKKNSEKKKHGVFPSLYTFSMVVYSTMVRIWACFSHPVLPVQVEVTGNSTNATTVKAATETDEGDEGKVGGVPIRGAPIGNHRKP